MKGLALFLLAALALATALPATTPSRAWQRQQQQQQQQLTARLRAAAADRGIVPVPESWYREQRVDHFDRQNLATFAQRYFVNDTFFNRGTPPASDNEAPAGDARFFPPSLSDT